MNFAQAIDLVSSSDDDNEVPGNLEEIRVIEDMRLVNFGANHHNDGDDAQPELLVSFDDMADTRSYAMTIRGPPRSMPRPKFMSWMRKGAMNRAVVNGAKHLIADFRQKVRMKFLSFGYRDELDTFPIFHFDEALHVHIVFRRRLPNSCFRQGIRDADHCILSGHANIPDTMKPDVDNLVKFVLDAMNGVAYTDDKQVARISACKVLDNVFPYEGRTFIFVKEINMESPWARIV